MSHVNPFTYKPKPYTIESLSKLKDDANALFAIKEFHKALKAYYHICEDYAHNEDDDVILLQMKCRLNMVASILELSRMKDPSVYDSNAMDKRELDKNVIDSNVNDSTVDDSNVEDSSIADPSVIDPNADDSKEESNHLHAHTDEVLRKDTTINFENEPTDTNTPIQHLKKNIPRFTIQYALKLVDKILKCEEANELHVKALYRKIHVLKEMHHIVDALQVTREAMKRFPNAKFFRDLFNQISDEELQRREAALSSEQRRIRDMTYRFSLFKDGSNYYGIYINDRKLSSEQVDKMTLSTFKWVQFDNTTKENATKENLKNLESLKDFSSTTNAPSNISLFTFNTHNMTAHISYIYHKGVPKPDHREILEQVCKAFFGLNQSTKRITVFYNSENNESESTHKHEPLDQMEIEQYQQLSLVMRDRYGNGVTVSSHTIQ